ncbi:hypothetical protein [Burkholderia gladioli]|uniref:hypothetical protein n=1 Tax=Burkholderia gladioli TaxID=28095 RepID=UPI0013DDDC06|nr:hypothetical protein [Burkholderia gladioli]MBU9272706.1 hypothetical protein [Burkholderia gladioli]
MSEKPSKNVTDALDAAADIARYQLNLAERIAVERLSISVGSAEIHRATLEIAKVIAMNFQKLAV